MAKWCSNFIGSVEDEDYQVTVTVNVEIKSVGIDKAAGQKDAERKVSALCITVGGKAPEFELDGIYEDDGTS